MKKSHYFVTIEGIEGVGKSTVLQAIEGWLKAAHIAYVCTREPGGTPIAEAIRDILLQPSEEKMTDLTELLLLFAGRAQHIASVIKPALAAGKWVICDRFTDASYAYQGAGRGMNQDQITQLADWTLSDLKPDITILLDANVDVALARAKQRKTPLDRFEVEQHAFFQRVREAYLACAKQDPQRYHVICADRPLEDVLTALQAVMRPYFP